MMHQLLALAALLAFSTGASAQTSLYAEVLGATGSYAVGVEQGVVASVDGGRRLAVRAGASYRTDRLVPGGSLDHVIAVPAGAVVSFSLGRPLGIALASDFGAGAVFERRSGGRFGELGESFALPRYAEALLQARLSERLAVRAGVLAGGARAPLERDGIRPVTAVTFGL